MRGHAGDRGAVTPAAGSQGPTHSVLGAPSPPGSEKLETAPLGEGPGRNRPLSPSSNAHTCPPAIASGRHVRTSEDT